MKQILVELDDRAARDLERVAPAKNRVRAEFIRRAIRHAIDLTLDLRTEEAYRANPFSEDVTVADLTGWDEQNELVQTAVRRRRKKAKR